MHINELKTSKYLRKEDVGEAGTVLTIARLRKENVAREDQEPDEKWIMFFKETSKGMVLNTTNASLIALALKSEETNDWTGRRIKLYFDPTVSFGGKLVGGIRVYVPKGPGQPAPKAEPAHDELSPPPADFDDDVPF